MQPAVTESASTSCPIDDGQSGSSSKLPLDRKLGGSRTDNTGATEVRQAVCHYQVLGSPQAAQYRQAGSISAPHDLHCPDTGEPQNGQKSAPSGRRSVHRTHVPAALGAAPLIAPSSDPHAVVSSTEVASSADTGSGGADAPGSAVGRVIGRVSSGSGTVTSSAIIARAQSVRSRTSGGAYLMSPGGGIFSGVIQRRASG